MCSTCYSGMLIEKCACDFSFAETKYLPKANLERKSLFYPQFQGLIYYHSGEGMASAGRGASGG